MDKQRIGIITHYYKSRNFGGVLQAYALCRYLKEMGFKAEQICYIHFKKTLQKTPLWIRLRNRSIADISRSALKRIINRSHKKNFQLQTKAMDSFCQNEIPHSAEVYTEDTVQNCQAYDVYITGSDQVWNPDWYNEAFFLNFVYAGKCKIAYAASVGHTNLTELQRKDFCEKLRDFSAVSVREEDAVGLVAPLSPVPVEWVLDPTLLLTREQWDDICAERMIQRPYLFCYFLGTNLQARNLALQYAKKKKLKVVSILHIHGTFRKCDILFGDQRLSGISPREFISLIKYADYIFTDSFHTAVFSELYRKEYAVFRRDGTDSMTNRIYSVTSIFDSQARFCNAGEKETLSYIESLPPLDQHRQFPLLESMRKRSHAFLKNSLPDQ